MKRILKMVLLATLILLAALLYYAYGERSSAPVVFVNGDVVTVTGEVAQALYVADGRIQAVGNLDTVLAQAGEARQIDLGGGALLPGLVEPHTHPIATALLGQTADISGFRYESREQIIQALKQAAQQYSPNGWVIAFGWDPVMLANLEAPTLAELDDISPDKPLLVLTQMMHDAYANSAALAAAGITADTPNPMGGEFIKNSNGELSGTIREVSAINMMFDAVPKPPELAVSVLTQLQLQRYAQAGYTSLGILGPVGRAADPLGLLRRLLDSENAPLRAQTWALPTQLEERDRPSGNERYGLRGVKFWMDGSPFAGGAAWEEAYENSDLVLKRLELPENHSPHLNFEQSEFESLFNDYHKRGFSIAVHVQGERAINAALDAAEKALALNPRADHRHRLEHNALITPQQIARAERLGITLSFFVDHVWFYGHRLPELIGDRVYRYMPLAYALKRGHRISFHGDHPATPLKPFRSLKTAVTRNMRFAEGKVAPSQGISVAKGLRAMTIDAAWQLGLDHETGSLEVGKAADLVWLSANPLSVAPKQLDEIAVQATWLAGQRVDVDWFSPANLRLVLESIF